MNDRFSSPLDNLGILYSNPIMNILEQQENIRALSATSAMNSMLEHAEQMEQLHTSSAIQAIQAQHSLVENHLSAINAISASEQIQNLAYLPSQSVVDAAVKSMQDFPVYDLATNMGKALEACIPKYDNMVKSLSAALENCIPQFGYIRETAFRLADNIPKIEHAVLAMAEQSIRVLDTINDSIVKSVSALGNALNSIDFSYLNDLSNRFSYIADFEVKNETLKRYGWYLILELPEEIVDEIYEKRDELKQEEVDALIINHFRNNRCQALKDIVNGWTALPYFESRKGIFHEAQVCHSRRSFNASTTLISLHFEGIVTDFVRYRMDTPTYRVEKALRWINDLTNDLTMGAMPFQNWIVCSFVLECIDKAFTTNFSPADPDSSPNTSRHKIAHGHAIEKETEANSLRRFLFMNELYKLFCCLENEYQLVS